MFSYHEEAAVCFLSCWPNSLPLRVNREKEFSPLSNFWLSRLLCPKVYRIVSENGNFGGCLWHSPITYPHLFLKIWSLVPHGTGSGDITMYFSEPTILPAEDGFVLQGTSLCPLAFSLKTWWHPGGSFLLQINLLCPFCSPGRSDSPVVCCDWAQAATQTRLTESWKWSLCVYYPKVLIILLKSTWNKYNF